MDKHESSELQAIDFVMGTHIAKAFEGISSVVGPREYRSFVRRRRRDKVFRFGYDGTPETFLSSYSAKEKKEPYLPAVLYYREQDFNNDELMGDIKDASYLYSEEFQETYNMSILPVNLTYKLAFLARDKLSIDKMQIAWYSYISNRKNHSFIVNFKLSEQKFPVPVHVVNPRSIMFSGLPVSEAGKLFCSEIDLSIRTQVLSGEEVSLRPHVEFIGEWTSGREVEKNYICEYGTESDLYLCTGEHVTSDTPDTPDSQWILFNEYEDCGEWIPEYTFNPADLALIPGEGYYLCLSQHDSTEENMPGVDSALWMHFCNSERITNPLTIEIIGERVGFIP